jgi:hypothetical protein
MSLAKRIKRRLQYEAHWRCSDPVVVIESDDWGLERRPCFDLVRQVGEPTDWTHETTETAEDLENLVEVLGAHRDRFNRPACLTANFVMANPDYEATRKAAYERLFELPLTVTLSDAMKRAYQDAMKSQCLFPQYHGIRHYNGRALLRDIRENGGARMLFDHGCATGISFTKGNVWRYHSEYADWSDNGSADARPLATMVQSGMSHFEQMFGFRSKSTIPPHYVVSEAAFRVWKTAGIRYVQGANYQIFAGKGGAKLIRSRYLGQRDPGGLLLMGRNVKFEPRPGRRETVERALGEARQMFAAQVPVIIDTHRINYTGRFRQQGLASLSDLLKGLRKFNPVFLTTAELAAAIEEGGSFRDSFRNAERSIAPLSSARQSIARKLA